MRKIKVWWLGKSIYGQLSKRIFGVLIFLLIVVEIVQFIAIRDDLYDSKETLLESRLHNVEIDLLRTTNTHELLEQNAPEIIRQMMDSNVFVTVVKSNGMVIDTVDDTYIKEYEENLLKRDKENNAERGYFVPELGANTYVDILEDMQIHKVLNYKSDSGEPYLLLMSKVGEIDTPTGLLQLSVSLKDVQERLLAQVQLFVLVALGVLILGLLVIRKVMIVTLKPLSDMTVAIDNLSVDALNARIQQEYGQEEINLLAEAYNSMLSRIDEAFQHERAMKEKMRQFISDASHELRTPLTSIHGFAEVLLMGAAKNETQLDLALNSILNESERLTQLVNDLLTLNRLEQNITLECEPMDLREVLIELKPQLELMTGNRNLELQMTESPLRLMGNKNQLKQVIINLVHNASQFTDEMTGQVQIRAYEDEALKDILLTVRDNGVGMSPEVKERVFDRFYRGQEHRSRAAGGYGLGLAIVKSIIDQIGGTITIESQLKKGTTFEMRFPKVKGEAS